MYKHALLLLNDEIDGQFLLQETAKNLYEHGTIITICHLIADYRELDIVSDSLTQDRQSTEIIAAKAMLSQIVQSLSFPVEVKDIVTINCLKDIETYISEASVDLLIMGHKNRLFEMFSSYSIEFTNHLSVDILIKHIITH